MTVPAECLISLCKTLRITFKGSNFKYKSRLLEATEDLNVPQHLMLSARMILEDDGLPGCPYGAQFLAYYKQLQTDDFQVWTKDEVAYYKRHGLPFEKPYDRYAAFTRFIGPLKERDPFLASRLANFSEVNHWWSIISTRNFAMNYK